MQQQRRGSGIILGLLVLGLIAVGALAVAAGPAQAVSGPGPYYAEPAWDRKLPVDTRFLVLTNWNSEAVLDKETGLVWERSPSTTSGTTWSNARSACTAVTTGNRKGWRLPSIHELASLIHPSVAPPGPTLPPGHPFLGVQSASDWSATTDADNPAGAWDVSFFNGLVGNGFKTGSGQVWCVRGGMHADQY